MAPEHFDYVAGGAGEERSIAENRAAFHRYQLRPRVLVDVSHVELGTTLLGTPVALPVGVAPMAMQGLAHPEGELPLAGGAAAAGAIYCLSTVSSRSLEEVAEVSKGPRWFQLYVNNRPQARRLVERAEAAGYGAIVLTVDLPELGYRERDLRNRFELNGPWGNLPANEQGGLDDLLDMRGVALTWADLDEIRSWSSLPLVIKRSSTERMRSSSRITAAGSSTGWSPPWMPLQRSWPRSTAAARCISTAACGVLPMCWLRSRWGRGASSSGARSSMPSASGRRELRAPSPSFARSWSSPWRCSAPPRWMGSARSTCDAPLESAAMPEPALPPNVHVSRHPLVAHKLSLLRGTGTDTKQFRELVRELSWLLGYEAMADLETAPAQVTTPLEEMSGARLGPKVGLVPVLRAGLGMVDAMLELLPAAQVWHIGLYRDERTLKPVEYYNKLPDAATVQVCLILDPMLATGGSAAATVDILKAWGAARIKQVSLIAAPEGIATLSTAHPDVDIHVAAVDRELNERGYIVPGLGDAGDRQFGTFAGPASEPGHGSDEETAEVVRRLQQRNVPKERPPVR